VLLNVCEFVVDIIYDTAHIGCLIALNRLNVFVMKTNLMHYLSLIYFVIQPLHVSGMFTAYHQEEFTVYVQQLVHVICLSYWLLAGSGWNVPEACRG
jgi:hypothetical protein